MVIYWVQLRVQARIFFTFNLLLSDWGIFRTYAFYRDFKNVWNVKVQTSIRKTAYWTSVIQNITAVRVKALRNNSIFGITRNTSELLLNVLVAWILKYPKWVIVKETKFELQLKLNSEIWRILTNWLLKTAEQIEGAEKPFTSTEASSEEEAQQRTCEEDSMSNRSKN